MPFGSSCSKVTPFSIVYYSIPLVWVNGFLFLTPISGLFHSYFNRFLATTKVYSLLVSWTPLHELPSFLIPTPLCCSVQGFGMLLMEEAERIAREEHGSGKIAVISGTWGRAKFMIPSHFELGTTVKTMLVPSCPCWWLLRSNLSWADWRRTCAQTKFTKAVEWNRAFRALWESGPVTHSPSSALCHTGQHGCLLPVLCPVTLSKETEFECFSLLWRLSVLFRN